MATFHWHYPTQMHACPDVAAMPMMAGRTGGERMTGMRKALAWLGGTVGGFCAAFLIYVVLGGLLALAFGGPSLTHSDSASLNAISYVTLRMPFSFCAQAGEWLYYVLRAADVYSPWTDVFLVADPAVYAFGRFLALPLSFIGFLAWRSRSPRVAWLLGIGFVGLSALIGSVFAVTLDDTGYCPPPLVSCRF